MLLRDMLQAPSSSHLPLQPLSSPAISTRAITSAKGHLILPHSFHVQTFEHNELDGD